METLHAAQDCSLANTCAEEHAARSLAYLRGAAHVSQHWSFNTWSCDLAVLLQLRRYQSQLAFMVHAGLYHLAELQARLGSTEL